MHAQSLPVMSQLLAGAMDCGCLRVSLSIGLSGKKSGVELPRPLQNLSVPGFGPISPVSPALRDEFLLLSHQGRP